MRKCIFILLFFLYFLVFTVPAPALEGISRDEVIEEAARLTGLSKDVMELLYDEAPSLFENIEQTAFTVKVLHLFVTARDNEAILELLNRSIDELRSLLLPEPLNTFITAINVYRTSLEVIRDYVFIPQMDETIYQRYRSMRLEDLRRGDTSSESQSTAFEAATTGWGSGYYVVRDKMYRELVKRKDYDERWIGERLEKYLRSQIDQFWMDALELRLQQEILAEKEKAITGALWQEVAGDLERLRREVLRRLETPAPTPVFTPTEGMISSEEEKQEAILAEYRALYPSYLEWYYKDIRKPFWVEIIANAEKIGENQYRVAYNLWQVIDEGPRKGEKYVSAKFDCVLTLEKLESDLAGMKKSLGRED